MGGEVTEGFLEERLFLLKVMYLFVEVFVLFGVEEYSLCVKLCIRNWGYREGWMCLVFIEFIVWWGR